MPVAVRVVVRSPGERRRLTDLLRASGFHLASTAPLEATMLATVRAEVELSTRQREMLAALVRCETPAALAETLGIEPKSAQKGIRSLERHLGVGSRHRLIVRLLEYGPLRVRPVPAPDEADPRLATQVTATALRVVTLDPAHHDRLTTCLRRAGENVMGETGPPYVVRLDEEVPDLPFTGRERDVLRTLLAHDRTELMAAELAIREHVVRDHLTSIYATLGVHTRDRLLVRLLAHGYLKVEPSS